MEEHEVATNGQTRALIRAIRIINREINDPERLDKALEEIEEVIDKEKDATAAQQATR